MPDELDNIDLKILATYFSVGAKDWPNLEVSIQANKAQLLSHFSVHQLARYLLRFCDGDVKRATDAIRVVHETEGPKARGGE